ncbi:MAG: type II toxin-antitoxin system HigB family toxin [Pyrinomonadaceae bacterium]|nr:type II toxin-antitoxin system HigB family toxin [Pyrinomonadaceae bacterium]
MTWLPVPSSHRGRDRSVFFQRGRVRWGRCALRLRGYSLFFNIRGKKYRFIARIVYRSQTVFIVAILTDEEYELGKWKE